MTLPKYTKSKEAFMAHMKFVISCEGTGHAGFQTELDVVSELTRDFIPDHDLWLTIHDRLVETKGELTPKERLSAVMYWQAGEELPARYHRLPRIKYTKIGETAEALVKLMVKHWQEDAILRTINHVSRSKQNEIKIEFVDGTIVRMTLFQD
jgi:hypothetical protein